MTQVIIFVFLALILLYGFRLVASQRRLLGIFWVLVSSFGIYLDFFPSEATRIANAMGIGRGTDLLFYVFACVMTTAAMLLASRIKTQERAITELARAIAIQGASQN